RPELRAGARGPRRRLHRAGAVRARAAERAAPQGTRGRAKGPRAGARTRGGALRRGRLEPHLRLGLARGSARLAACGRAQSAPTMFLPTIHLGLLYNHVGKSAEAIAPLELAVTASGRHPWTLAALAVCYSSLARLGEVEAIRDELVARARREYVQSSTLAIVAASLGRMDDAFELLDRACDEHDGILVYSKRYPFFKLLQADPRMARIYGRIGFPEGGSYAASSTRP